MKKINRIIIVVTILLIIISSCTIKKKDYYIENGAVLEEYYVKWPSKELVRHGKSKTYSSDGTLLFEGGYYENKLHGICSSFYENGQIEYIVKYDKGHLVFVKEYYDIEGNKLDWGFIDNGKGFLKKYTSLGELSEEGPVVNGLREGEWRIYNNNIGMYYVQYYKNGVAEGENFEFKTF